MLIFVDLSTIRYMRSEFLKGFTESKEFQLKAIQLRRSLGSGILETIRTILPSLPKGSDADRLRELESQILQPAINLAISLKTSATVYCFDVPDFMQTPFAKMPLKICDLDEFKMVNVDTRETLKVSSLDGGTVTAEQVLFMSPGLLRKDHGKEKRQLALRTVCVKLVKPRERKPPKWFHLESFTPTTGTFMKSEKGRPSNSQEPLDIKFKEEEDDELSWDQLQGGPSNAMGLRKIAEQRLKHKFQPAESPLAKAENVDPKDKHQMYKPSKNQYSEKGSSEEVSPEVERSKRESSVIELLDDEIEEEGHPPGFFHAMEEQQGEVEQSTAGGNSEADKTSGTGQRQLTNPMVAIPRAEGNSKAESNHHI